MAEDKLFLDTSRSRPEEVGLSGVVAVGAFLRLDRDTHLTFGGGVECQVPSGWKNSSVCDRPGVQRTQPRRRRLHMWY